MILSIILLIFQLIAKNQMDLKKMQAGQVFIFLKLKKKFNIDLNCFRIYGICI